MTEPDSSFDGINDVTLPEPDLDFSCKSNDDAVQPEVAVDIKQGDRWVRIPVTSAELWINKDGPADITRTAKIQFPFEWGEHSIIQYVNGFDSNNNIGSEQDKPYDVCRIFFRDPDIGQWVIAHYGYVGGVGPAGEDPGVGKFWVYDPADLMSGIMVSKSWGNPTLPNVVDFALNGVDERGRDVGLSKRSVFESPIEIYMAGEQGIPTRKKANIKKTFDQEYLLSTSIPIVGAIQLQLTGLFANFFDFITSSVIDPLLGGGQKRFQVNRHNMVDHLEWAMDLIDARWWFEPSPNGPVLLIDATAFKKGQESGNYERRYFVDNAAVGDWIITQQVLRLNAIKTEIDRRNENPEVDDELQEKLEELPEDISFRNLLEKEAAKGELSTIEPDDVPFDYLPPHDYAIYDQVNTLNNSALSDIKPFNTMVLHGESTTYRTRYAVGGQIEYISDVQASTSQDFSSAASSGGYTKEYPYVEVTYSPLVSRAGGHKYSAQPITSDKVYLDDALQQAKKEFRKHLAEQTEGSMELRGEPNILPHDYIVTMPTCNDTYNNVNAEPVTWEVNGVKHTVEGGEDYTTELGVSMTFDDRHLNVTAEYRKA